MTNNSSLFLPLHSNLYDSLEMSNNNILDVKFTRMLKYGRFINLTANISAELFLELFT